METIQTVGIDIGAGALKVCTELGTHQIPAQVARRSRDLVDQSLFGIANEDAPVLIEAQGWAYWCGPNAHTTGAPVTDFGHDRFDSAPTRALIYTALTAVRASGVDSPIRVVIGLPQGTATGDGAAERMEAAKKWLVDDGGEHKWTASGTRQRARIAEVLMTSQPRGALVDAITAPDGTVTREGKTLYKGRVGVVSIGFNTLELMALDGGVPMSIMASGEMLGVRRLLETLNTSRRRSPAQMDADLRKGRLALDGQLANYGREILAHIADTWGEQWRDWDGVIAVGGGSVLLREQLRGVFGGRLVAVDDPVMSTARGLYKLGLQQARKAVTVGQAKK